MRADDLVFHASWRNRPLNGRQYVKWVHGLLQVLEKNNVQPLFVWNLDQPETSARVSWDSESLESLLVSNLDKEVAYFSPPGRETDPLFASNAFTLESFCPLGFQCSFVSKIASGVPCLVVRVDVGSSRSLKNSLDFRISSDCMYKKYAKEMFVALVEYAKSEHAVLWRSRASVRFTSVEELGVGWLTYFNSHDFKKLLPVGSDVTEMSGGFFVQAYNNVASPEDDGNINSNNKFN